MQLKIRRSQRDGGVISTNVIFCLDARIELTAIEQQSVTRYKLQNQVIYNSEASKKNIARGDAQQDGSAKGSLKAIAWFAVASMRLNITIASLQRGQHVECKSMDELLGAEQAIMEACQNLRGYLDTASTFDGQEVLFDFSAGSEPVNITPQTGPRLVAPPPSQILSGPYPQIGGAVPLVTHASAAGGGAGTGSFDPTPEQRRVVVGVAIVVALLFLAHSCHFLI